MTDEVSRLGTNVSELSKPGSNKPDVDDLDLSQPNVARMYDYVLGGGANFAADRAAADAAIEAWPYFKQGARLQRKFMARVVRYLAERGVDQFLDLGSGIPTAGNVHEIAHRVNPDAAVAYVDYEPVAVHTARKMLADQPKVSITKADIRDPHSVLSAPTVTSVLDFARPIAVLAFGVLHFLPDTDRPAEVVGTYRDACPRGSFLAITHASQVSLPDEQVDEFLAAYARTATPALWRSRDEIARFMSGYTLVAPGLVLCPAWHPESPVTDEEANASNLYGALGRLDK